jgi:hypothetical protein
MPENKIIPVCMPPHSSHLLQPLNVGCFAVLKRHYGQLVEQQIRLGFNHIDKIDFLTAFPQARTMAYKAQTIRNSFVRRQFRCSGCGIEGHKITRYPNRTSN